MKKLDPTSLKANWGVVENRSPAACVTSVELSKVLGVHHQTCSNWKMRGILPAPEPRSRKFKGNKNYYRISKIRAWLERVTEEEINRRWLRDELEIKEFITAGQVEYLMQTLTRN